MMPRTLILIIYLADELLSTLLPFSSGLFAAALVLMLLFHRIPVALITHMRVFAFALAALILGTVGASVSGTPITLFSVATLGLLAALWAGTSGLRGGAGVLIGPRHAFIGVMVSVIFLVLALVGLDVYSIMSGQSSNRPCGLFLEPSHLALYVVPMWLIAFRERRLRPWLYGALTLILATRFSATLVGLLLTSLALTTVLRKGATNRTRNLCVALLAVTLISTLPLPISIGGETVPEYLGSRLSGLAATDESDDYNLSSLVVLQGLELAILSFRESAGLGVGLGNFGTAPPIIDQSTFRSIINTVTPSESDLNLRDGGLLASKLLGELGMLAIGIVLLIVRHIGRLRNVDSPTLYHYHMAWATALVGLLLLRALPYFSAPACLVIASMASLVPVRRFRFAARTIAAPSRG